VELGSRLRRVQIRERTEINDFVNYAIRLDIVRRRLAPLHLDVRISQRGRLYEMHEHWRPQDQLC